MSEKRYAELELRFTLGGIDHKIKAITSMYGSIRVFDYDRAKAVFGDLLGKIVPVKFSTIQYEMYFTREFHSDGRFYNLKFINLDSKRRTHLQKLIATDGMDPPWQRMHPRLDAISREESVVVPSVAVVRYKEGMEVYRVLNFTLGGALLEASNPSFEPLELGLPILFDLRVSNGEELTGINGRIVRLGMEKLPDMEHRLLTVGLKIIHMKSNDLEKYKFYIRHYCEVLRIEFGG